MTRVKVARLSLAHPGWRPLVLGGMSAANIATNFLFQWLVLTVLGPGLTSDALFAGMTVPQLFASIVSASLSHVLVPIFAGEAAEDQRRDAWTLLLMTSALFAALSALLMASAAWWMPITVPGFDATGKQLAVDLAQISLLGMAFTGMSAVQSALGMARYQYIWVDAAPLVANVVAAGLLAAFMPTHGVWAAAWISVLRLMVQTLLLMPLMGRPGAPMVNSPSIRTAWARLKPILIGASYYKMDPMVDRYLLSAATPGAMSMLYLAQQLHAAGSQVIVKALAVPAITQLSAAHKQGLGQAYRSTLTRTMKLMLCVSVVAILVVALVGKAVLAWVLVHGAFTVTDAHQLWLMYLISAGMLVGGAAGTLTAGAFYAQGDTHTPTWLASVVFTVGIGLKLIMFKSLGVLGLAAAISAYYMASLAAQWHVLHKRMATTDLNASNL
jgi:putative peptidoglycan lipid II flippase